MTTILEVNAEPGLSINLFCGQGPLWLTTAGTLEAYNSSHFASYISPGAESGGLGITGLYTAQTGLPPSVGWYWIFWAPGSDLTIKFGRERLYWDGTAWGAVGGGVDPVTIAAATVTALNAVGVVLQGSASVAGPTAKQSWVEIVVQAFQRGTAELVARVKNWKGADLIPTDVSSILYTIYGMDAVGGQRGDPIMGYRSVALTPSAVVLASVISDAYASNYNFKHIPAASPWLTAGWYQVEYTITLSSGEPIVVRFKVKVI